MLSKFGHTPLFQGHILRYLLSRAILQRIDTLTNENRAAYPVVPGATICGTAPPRAATGAMGAMSDQSAIAERIPGEVSERDELCNLPVRATLAGGLRLPRLRWRAGVRPC